MTPDACACVLKCSTHEAAGELLKALKAVCDLPVGCSTEQATDIWRGVRKAIAKAEGK